MTIDHNRITGGGTGHRRRPTTSTNISDTTINGNKLVGPFGEDAIRLNRYHDSGDRIGILIEGNEITSVRENGNHTDCLQTVWGRRPHRTSARTTSTTTAARGSSSRISRNPVQGIVVDNNLFLRNSEPCDPPGTSCGQPTYFQIFGPYSDFKMTRNTIWGGQLVASFQDGTGADTMIESNVVYRLWTNTNLSSITYANNTLCKREGPPAAPGLRR